MYEIYADNILIWSPLYKELAIFEADMLKEVNKANALNFTLLPNHPFYNSIKKLETIIEVREDGKLDGQYRVLKDDQDINKEKEVVCEGELAYLYDSLIEPFEQQGFTVVEFYTKILTEHNAQVNEQQQFLVGDVDVVDPNDYISRESEKYITAYAALKTRLLDKLGGYLIVRYDADGKRYLDYLTDYPDTSTQRIRYGENMLSFFREASADETYTACIPLGAKIKNEETDAEIQLTIESVNDGKKYLINETLAAQLGVIYAPVEDTTWEDVTLAANLKTKGLEYLNTVATRFAETISVTAIDLHAIDPTIEELAFGDYIIVESEMHGILATYLAGKVRIPLDDEAEKAFTLGSTTATLTDSALTSQYQTTERIENIEADYVTNSVLSTTTAVQQQEITSLIAQTAEKITLAINSTYTTKTYVAELVETLLTQIEIHDNQVDFRFLTMLQQIEILDGNTSQQYSEILKYIRFVDGSIVLGRSDSQIKLRLENDILYFFSGADETADRGTAWAYFDSGKLYVPNLEVTNIFQLGNFAFLPRPSGNLSLMMNKGE